MEPRDWLSVLAGLADRADRISLGRFRAKDLHVESKPDRTLVTEADVAIEELVRAEIALSHPEVGGEISVDPIVHPWDIAPIQVIVEEAGGRATTLEGERDVHGGSLVATIGLLHDEVLASLAASDTDLR